MSYLLDTHTVLWSIGNSDLLSRKARTLLSEPENIIYVSAVSLWEISIKFGLKKLNLENLAPEDIPRYIEKIGFEMIELSAKEA